MSGSGPRRVLLFGKIPRPGHAKTRLAPALGPEGAARLYRAFLDDTVELARASGVEQVELWLADRPEEADGIAARHPQLRLRRQAGDELGSRLRHAFETAFREGVERAAAVGTDHPTLPPDRIRTAFRAVRDADAALGPSPDGGYHLLAVRRAAWPGAEALFREIPWSTGEVAAMTRRRAREAGLALRELEPWYDVDEPAELERLRRDAAPDTATARALERLDAGGG